MIKVLFDNITSTQDVPRIIKSSLEKNQFFIIQAFNQSKGTGRYNRKWHSPNGSIYFTLCFKYKHNLITYMNGYICYLLHNFFKNKYNLLLDYKWPNDLYYNGKKLIGILTQNEITGKSCIYKIGIGINVNNSQILKAKPIFLNQILDTKFNIIDLSNSIHDYIYSKIFQKKTNSIVVKYLNKYLLKNTTTYTHHFNSNQIYLISVVQLNNNFTLKIIQNNLLKNISYGEIN